MIVFSQYNSSLLNAGPKAKVDVNRILSSAYNAKIFVYNYNEIIAGGTTFTEKLIYKIKKSLFILMHKNPNDIVIIQHPFTNNKKLLKLFKNKIAYIHDLVGIRALDDNYLTKEIDALKEYNKIIVHNNKMKDFLLKKGIEKTKVIVLDLFDYLCDFDDNEEKQFDPHNITIVYTGNLNKSPFLKQIEDEKMRFNINVYGVGSVINTNKIHYMGKYQPDDLPRKIDGDLGLVWDGDFDEKDEFCAIKNYTKYNNPHKLSCYIAAEIPVIAWKKAAIADFIKENDIGYLIDDLYEINNIDFGDYYQKQNNVKQIGYKVRNGYYTRKAVDKIINTR